MAAKKEITADTAEEMVEIKLPLPRKKNEPDYELVGYNLKMYQIKKGETVVVPKGVKNILDLAEEAKEAQLENIRSRAN